MKLQDATLKTKLVLLSTSGIVTCILVALVGYLALKSASETETFLAEDAVPSLVLISGINDSANNIREVELTRSIAANAADASADETKLNGYFGKITQSMSAYDKAIDNDDERKRFAALSSNFSAYRSAVLATFAAAKSSDSAALDEMRRRARVESGKAFSDLGDAVDALVNYNEKAVEVAHASAASANQHAVATLAGLAIVAAIFLLGFGAWVTKGLLRQFGGEPRTAVEVARAVAKGDLRMQIVVATGDTESVMA